MMSCRKGFVLCAVACAWWFVSDVQAAAPVNLLTNGGFENGTTGWEPDAKHERLEDRNAAHSGLACLTGTVTKPNQALRLNVKVQVKAGNRYEFAIWARATNRTKLVLFATRPGQSVRESVAAWKDVPRRWVKYVVPMSFKTSGELLLEIISPSSYGSPAGQIWIDDIALLETEMPPLVSVSNNEGFNDEPAMAVASNGSAYVAWNSFRDSNDSLQIARLQRTDKGFQVTKTWQVLGGPDTYVLGPRAIALGNQVLFVYAAEDNKDWNIHAVRCGVDGPGKPIAITSATGVDAKPSVAAHGDSVWIAWETNRNGLRQIMAASLQDDAVSKPVLVSQSDSSSYDPTVAVLATGDVYVAWHSFRENNMDVYASQRQAAGNWLAPRRLTTALTIDRNAAVFARGDEAWIVYENTNTDTYHICKTNDRRLIAARITPEGLYVPKGQSSIAPLAQRCEAAAPCVDDQGRIWIAFLKPRLPRAGWDTYVTCFAGGSWQRPSSVSLQKGMDRRPSLAFSGDQALIAFQSDDSPNSWSDLDQMAKATSNIFLAALNTANIPENRPIQLAALEESDAPFEPGQLRIDRGEDTPTESITYEGRTLHLYYGALHEHSDVSICNRVGDQSIDEDYQSMRDVARHDFACLTDHGYNINAYLWGWIAKQARVNHDPGRFLTFLAEEWTSTFEEYSEEHPYGFYGHRNLIFADPYFPRWWNARNRQTPAEVWEDLRRLNANFIHIPHQIADTGNVPTDWNFTDEVAQPVAEIFQTRGSYEYKGAPREAKRSTPGKGYFIQDAWARGIVIGAIASPDHGGGYGKACVFAPELTAEAILDAIRQRHCYGTSGAKIFLDVRVNGHLMGEKVPELPGKSVEVKITTRCPMPIQRVDICRNNEFVYSYDPDGNEASLNFVDRAPLTTRSYYYVRVILEDEELAWSSPVWFGAK